MKVYRVFEEQGFGRRNPSALEGVFDWMSPIVSGQLPNARVVVTTPSDEPRVRMLKIESDDSDADIKKAVMHFLKLSNLLAELIPS